VKPVAKWIEDEDEDENEDENEDDIQARRAEPQTWNRSA
jgi:hypothetical protein